MSAILACIACEESVRDPMGIDVALERVDSVGLLDGPEELVFGRILGVQAAADGSFFVLDRQAVAVRWFNATGEYLAGITSRGQGPGELQSPWAMSLTADGRLGVVDSGNGRISTYRVASGELAYEGEAPVVLSPYGSNQRNLCGIGERWFLYQQDQGFVVREYGLDGQEVRTFQPALRLPAEEFGVMTQFAEPAMNSGMLLCAADRSLVVSVPIRSDTVRAYSAADAALVWQRPLEGISPEPYVLDDRPGFPQESDGAHVGVSLVRWDANSLLVQYRFWAGNRADPDVTRMESIQVSLETGEELARTVELPIIADIRGDMVYTYENEPYPRVVLLRRIR